MKTRRWHCSSSGQDRWYSGSSLPRSFRLRFGQLIRLGYSKFFVLLPTSCHCFLRLFEEKLRHGWLAVLQHAIAALSVDVVLQRNLCIARIELEQVLVVLDESRI